MPPDDRRDERDALRQFALEASWIGEWDLDLETRRATRSLVHDRIFGYESGAPEWSYDIFLNRHVHPSDRGLVDAAFQRTLATNEPWDFECRIIRVDGEVRWIWARGSVYFGAGGEPARILGVVQDVSARKRTEAERDRVLKDLELERSRLATVFQQAPAAIAILRGPNHVFELANPYYHRLVGERELIGRPIREALPDIRDQGFFELLDRVFRTGEPYRAQSRRVVFHDRESGREQETYQDFVYIPLREADGVISGIFVHAADVTEHQEARDALAAAQEELERRVEERTAELRTLNEELESFNYSVSHDMRAPLRSIDGFSHALLEDYEGELDDTGRHYLHRIRAGTERMGRLIDDLLDLSRLSRASGERRQVDLSALAEATLEQLRANEPGRNVCATVQPGLTTVGDEGLLAVVLENLLGNAWKFTRQEERARIEFGASEQNGELVYYVRDNGAGFDERYVRKIFAPFQRLHAPTAFEGTGIGLAIVQRILRKHGGTIWARGRVDSGATFWFSLPGAAPFEGRD